MPKIPIIQALKRQTTIQAIPIKVAIGISLVERIDIKRTKICG